MPHPKQVSTADQSIEEGSKRYLKRTRNLKKKGQESKTLHGRFLYKRYIDEFSKELLRLSKLKASGRASAFATDWVEIQNLKLPLVAHFTLQTILDSLSTETPRNRLAVQIGQKLEDELNLSRLKKSHPKWWKTLEKFKKLRSSYKFKRALAIRHANREFGDTWLNRLPVTTKAHIGLTLIELFRAQTGLIEYTKRRIGLKRFESVVLPTSDAVKWLNNFNERASVLFPFHLPCEETPPDWINPDTGGYSYPEDIGWSFVKTHNKTTKDFYSSNNINTALKAANVLQRVPFRVNPWVLSVVSEGISKGFRFGECCNYSSEVDLSRPPQGINSIEHFRRSQAQKHRLRRKMMPKFIQTSTVMTLANKYRDQEIYFPVQADFRGRLYYVPKCLNPQGPMLAKGLLHFANPTSIRGAEDWFLVGGANVFGLKGSLQSRQKWVLDNEKRIQAVVENPFGEASFWLEAAEPFLFLAFCKEFVEWNKPGVNHETRLPVRLDHTASGLQIVALLQDDKELQRLTNLTDADEPVDVYMVILNSMQAELGKSPRPEDHLWRIDRALTKLLTINFMYGGTLFGLERTAVQWYIENHDDVFGRKIYKEIRRLIDLYKTCLSKISTAPQDFMDSTRDEQQGHILSWESPSGFPVSNSYFQQTSHPIKTSVNGERIRGRVNVQSNSKISTKQARQALPANKVHSYDSGLLHLLLTNDEWPNILTLHDCYGVPPKDCERLIKDLSTTLGAVFGIDMPSKMWYAAS